MAELNKEQINEVNAGTLGPGYFDSFPYQIKPNEYLNLLANRFRTSVKHIMDLNPKITDPDKIRAWDWINMPYPDY